MNRIWKIILSLIGLFLAFIAIIGLYRSLVDKTPFIVGFDRVAGVVISEFWKFISNPLIFTPLAIIGFLIYTKNYWIELLPRMRKLSLGGASAEFEFNRIVKQVEESRSARPTIKTHKGYYSIENLVYSLTDETAWFLLKSHNKFLNINEIRELVSSNIIPNMTGGDMKSFTNGYYLGLVNLEGILFNLSLQDTKKEIKIVLLPAILEQLHKKLNISPKSSNNL